MSVQCHEENVMTFFSVLLALFFIDVVRMGVIVFTRAAISLSLASLFSFISLFTVKFMQTLANTKK